MKTLIQKRRYHLLEEVSAILLKKWLLGRRRKLIARERQIACFAYDLIGIEINVDGVYGGDDLDALFKWLHNSRPTNFFEGTALDIGANIGNHALYFSDHFAKVLAIEANPRTFKVLELNSTLVENIRCINVGASNSLGIGKMSTNSMNVGGAKIVRQSEDSDQDVNLARLDDLVPQQEKVTFIKIDVEGHEYQALLGARETIKNNHPTIIFEQTKSDFEGGHSKTIELLKSYGYEKFFILENKSPMLRRLPPLVRYSITPIAKLLLGDRRYLVEQKQFENRFYPFIIAAKEATEI